MRSGIEARRLSSNWQHMLVDNRGATAAIFAIAMPLLAGMAALAVDVGLWSVQKRHAQGAADQAAYSAAIASIASDDDAAPLEAMAVTASMGLVDGQDGVEISTTKLDSLGGESGEFWEVIVEQPQPMWFAALFMDAAPTARARAVAGLASGGSACIIGLSTSGTAVRVDNNNSISNPGCAVYSNSNMSMRNGSEIEGTAFVAGAIDKQNANQIDIGREVTGVTPIPDPYADAPSPPPCTNSSKITDGGNYAAGQYCGGVNIKNNANANNKTVNLAPGVHYIGSTFNLENNITVNGSGVTIVIMPGANFSINNNVTFNITAPTSGPYAGIAIMGRNLATNSLAWNNGTFNIQGALYFPNQQLSIKNNFNADLCTQIVAFTVLINNNADMFDQCPGSGIRDVGGSGTVALLE